MSMMSDETHNLGQIQQTKGFTLVELMVALLVLAIGLLGLAGLQAKSLSNNHGAYLRTQAVLLAEDMADRMRANASAAGLTAYLRMMEREDVTCPCTSTQLAKKDLFQWHAAVTALPGGDGTVTGAAPVYTITVTWKERVNQREQDVNESVQKTFAMSFQP